MENDKGTLNTNAPIPEKIVQRLFSLQKRLFNALITSIKDDGSSFKLSTFSLLIQFMEVHHEKEEFADCDHRYSGNDHDSVRWLRRRQ